MVHRYYLLIEALKTQNGIISIDGYFHISLPPDVNLNYFPRFLPLAAE